MGENKQISQVGEFQMICRGAPPSRRGRLIPLIKLRLGASQFFTSGKEPSCQCRRHERPGFSPWVGKIPWKRAWQPTPVFLPGESHGQRSLVGYSPQDLKEANMNEWQASPAPVWLHRSHAHVLILWQHGQSHLLLPPPALKHTQCLILMSISFKHQMKERKADIV